MTPPVCSPKLIFVARSTYAVYGFGDVATTVLDRVCGVDIDEIWGFAERSKRGERRAEWLALWDGVMGMVVELRRLRDGSACPVCAQRREAKAEAQRRFRKKRAAGRRAKR